MSLKPGQLIQFRRDSGQLLSGRLLWAQDDHIAVEVDASQLDYEALENTEQPVHLYYEHNCTFVQHQTQVEGVIERPAAEEPTPDEAVAMDLDDSANRIVVVFELLNSVATAENRECYRVRTASYGISVEFADRDDCELMDISHTGFALLSDQKFEPGAIVRACLPQDNGMVCGNVRIQSVRPLRDGRFRYGVRCLGVETEKACAGLAVELQRRQLQLKAAESSI